MTTFDTTSGLRVLAPGDGDWDAARQAFNLLVDQRPALIAIPQTAAEVAAVVRFARAEGLRVAPQSTGHNAGPLGSLEDAVLLKTSEMKDVELDVAARRARVQAGAVWEDVVPRASGLGLAALHGSSPDVGIVGYSLGGGMGWMARKHGLQTNSVTAIELVTADGERVRADHDNEPELFWALRGGGGNFGVVTAIEFDLYPVEAFYAGAMFFPIERASEVLHAWHELTARLPDEITSVGRVLSFPPLEIVPEIVRGQSFAIVEAAYLGGEAEGAELLRPIRELGPVMDTFAMVPPAGLAELHMDPRDPVPFLSGHQLVGDLPSKAIDDVLDAAAVGHGSPLLGMELRHTGGALARVQEHHGANASMNGSYAMFAGGAVMDEGMSVAIQAQLALVTGALAPYDVGRYLNFVEEPAATDVAFPAETYRRLRAVKAQYDPEGRFQANHAIPAA
jgi:FAD/FMN-containing dehydrogenase